MAPRQNTPPILVLCDAPPLASGKQARNESETTKLIRPPTVVFPGRIGFRNVPGMCPWHFGPRGQKRSLA